jgi:hypothetical protein
MVGEGAAAVGLAAFVAGDQMRALGGRQQQFGLGRLAGLLRIEVDQLQRAETQRLAREGGAPGIVVRERGLRPAPRLADGRDGKPQAEAWVRWALSTAQIFSML